MEVLSFPLFFLWAPGGCVVVLLGFPSKVCFCMYPYKVSFSCLSLLAVHMFMAEVYTTCQIPTKFNESEARSLRKPSIESHVLGCYRIHTCLAVHHVFADLSARCYFLGCSFQKVAVDLIFSICSLIFPQLLQWFVLVISCYSDLSRPTATTVICLRPPFPPTTTTSLHHKQTVGQKLKHLLVCVWVFGKSSKIHLFLKLAVFMKVPFTFRAYADRSHAEGIIVPKI